LKLKNGFAELGMCLPPGMCQSLCNFFNEELGTPDSRHTVVNGNRALLIVHPSTNKDERMLNFIALVKHMMTERFPTQFPVRRRFGKDNGNTIPSK